MGYLVGPAVLWPREGILETRRLVSSQTFYAAPGFGVWYSGFSYDHKRVRVLERPISPEKKRLTKNFRRWPWCSNAWRDSGRAYPLLRRQNRALLAEWPNLIALNFAFFNSCQPCPKAFSARSVLDSTVSCDVTEKDSPALSQTSRGQMDNEARERLGTGLNNCILS